MKSKYFIAQVREFLKWCTIDTFAQARSLYLVPSSLSAYMS